MEAKAIEDIIIKSENGEGDYTAERREKIEKLDKADFQAFSKEQALNI